MLSTSLGGMVTIIDTGSGTSQSQNWLGLGLGLGLGLERHRLVQEAQVRPRVARPAAAQESAVHVRDKRADVAGRELGA